MKNILVQAFLSLLVLQVVGAQGDASAPDYFDSLRLSPPGVVAKAPEDGSTVYRVAVTSLDDNSTVAYRLAGLMGFLPFTDVNSGERILPETINDAFAALMAVYHFNNIQKSPILTEEDVAECPDLRLTMELLDTEFSPIETTRAFTSVLQRTPSFRVPFPSAVIGAYRSAVTSPLAILTGVNDIPQVSYASTAVDFDVKAQYPLFGRTVTSSIGEAEAAVQYFKSINSTHVAILFVTVSTTVFSWSTFVFYDVAYVWLCLSCRIRTVRRYRRHFKMQPVSKTSRRSRSRSPFTSRRTVLKP